MNWISCLTGKSFEIWIQKTLSIYHISQGQRLDPFDTSNRNFKTASDNLRLASTKSPLPKEGDGRNQVRTDLAKALLVNKVGDSDGVELTEFGRSVLTKWEEVDVASDNEKHELLRCIIVMHLGLVNSIDFYCAMETFWSEIMASIPFADAIKNSEFLYLVSYLNLEVDGFNPWAVIRNSKLEIKNTTIDEIIGLKECYVRPPSEKTEFDELVNKLVKRVNRTETRPNSRKVFCTAMQLLKLSSLDRTNLLKDMKDFPDNFIGEFDQEPVDAYLKMLDESGFIFGVAGRNVIFFGPPGTGKSFEVKKEVGTARMFRTQFHPEYSHSDFIGSYRPVVGSESDAANKVDGHDGVVIARPVNYFAFVPGPFALALKYAFENPLYHVYLVIEEINRGDCSAIFGDVFQLLDRDDTGRSEFGITAKPELLTYFEGKIVAGYGQLYLPPNLSLLATMNTSDQSLYPMDSAFKRRWQWKYCTIDFEQLLAYTGNVRPTLKDLNENWDWIIILKVLNKKIVLDNMGMEDKQLGPWFIKPKKTGEVDWNTFLNKCLFYLWHDVFKDQQDDSPFNTETCKTFGEVQANIRTKGLEVGFKPEVIKNIREMLKEITCPKVL